MLGYVIDIETPRSPGWWLNRLLALMADRRRSRRLQLLHNYRSGNAPLPQGAEAAREAFTAFQRKARSNFAELVVSATSERMTPVGFRTAQDADESGDSEVGQLWERAGLDMACANVHDLMLSLSEAYVIVGAMDNEIGAPLITFEDPRWMVGDPDPANPRKLMAALKVLHDDIEKEDRAYVYLPADPTVNRETAEVWVAVRPASTQALPTTAVPGGQYDSLDSNYSPVALMGSASSMSWDMQRSGPLPHPRIPVVRFLNKDGVGEYEWHLDIIDRINHQILQRMVISTMQAFRQRAVSGLPLVDEETGEEIDYRGVFTADPAALWQLPETAKMWESQQGDLTQILNAVKDDVEHLAAVTRTPMHMMSPSGQRQSAEGASLSREGLVFKCRDRITRTGHSWAQVMSLALLAAGQPERADLAKLRTIWANPEHLSLAERGDAASKLALILPKRTLYITVLGLSPDDADRALTELADEQLQQQLAAQALAAANPQQPAQQGAGSATSPAGPASASKPAAKPSSGGGGSGGTKASSDSGGAPRSGASGDSGGD